MSCDVSRGVTAVSTSQSALNLLRKGFTSALEADDNRSAMNSANNSRSKYRLFSHKIVRHIHSFSDRLSYNSPDWSCVLELTI